MNNPFVLQQSEAVAARQEVAESGERERRISLLYEIVYARKPSSDEIKLGLEFFKRDSRGKEPPLHSSLWKQYAQALIMANEFTFID